MACLSGQAISAAIPNAKPDVKALHATSQKLKAKPESDLAFSF
jgi:hypothetical protein